MQIAARAPNHLGDGVMALPALQGLAQVGALTIYAPPWGPELYREVPARVLPLQTMDGDVAVLFPPSLRALWQARRIPRRIGTPTDWRRRGLTDVVPWTPKTAEVYRSLAAVLGAEASGPPRFRVALTDGAADVPRDHVGLVPISAGGRSKEWSGYRALADALEQPVVFYGGPGEAERVAQVAGPHPQCVGLPLSALAATLQTCRLIVTNDSGLAHFGRAVGVPVVTVHGPTAAAWTGAPGAIAVEGPALPCRPCRSGRCRVGDNACLDIPVARVLAAANGVLRG